MECYSASKVRPLQKLVRVSPPSSDFSISLTEISPLSYFSQGLGEGKQFTELINHLGNIASVF